MLINEQLEKRHMTKYRLSKESGVPQATINDICSGKAELEKCSAGTLYRIAQVLGISIEDILESDGTAYEPPPPCGAEPRPMEVVSKPFGL